MSNEHAIFTQRCRGCSRPLQYQAEASGASPGVVFICIDSSTPYRGGHLCNRCYSYVEEQFDRMREQRKAAAARIEAMLARRHGHSREAAARRVRLKIRNLR